MRKLLFAASLAILSVSCAAPTALNTDSVASSETQSTVSEGSLAYVNIDLVIAQSDIFTNEGLPLQKRSETAQRELSQKEQAIQSDAAKLQQKYQSGLITSANAQKEQTSIENRVKAFQTSAQKQMAELEEENTVLVNRTQAMVSEAIKNINEGYKYKMIISAAALIDADSTLDISNIVLEEVNKLYKAEQ